MAAGRWSLVDHFDTDGRRFLVAHKNDPELASPNALTLCERQIAACAAMGLGRRWIVDPGTERLTVHRLLADGSWR